MFKNISVAVLGSTGYVGLELINILSKHPNVKINFLGSNSAHGINIRKWNKFWIGAIFRFFNKTL